MSNFTISPNMMLPVPIPGQDPGPDYATNNSNSLNIIDVHNHSAGQGVQINPNGLNINADLPMNGNNLTLVNTINFTALGATLPGIAPNLGCLYVAGNELVYNDEAGNIVPITNNGNVNAGAGSITGLPSGTAGVSYSSVSKTFVFQSATSTPANLDGGSVIVRKVIASSPGITIAAPNSLSADYTATLPAAPPSVPSFLSMDTSGTITASTPVIPSANIIVSSGTGSIQSTTSATYVDIPGMSTTITTVGRPVRIGMQPDGIGVAQTAQTNSGSVLQFALLRDGVIIGEWIINVTSERMDQSPSAFNFIDVSPSAATHIYKWQFQVNAGTGSLLNTVSVAWEMYQ